MLIRISHIGLRAPTCWVALERRTLRGTLINERSAWKATLLSGNTSAGVALIFPDQVDESSPIH